ncbi:MAG: VOC family protein [Porticoccaceae bacterium]|nr:VOC family protein [Pseudomonadales bacterium]MCP5170867.1 VOC family protein [Pseudomonadales bacterium]MCP5301893.1 VOC family protein [Pseudomonadales bacterium]
MFSHIMIGTNDLQKSIEFYDRVMPSLGYSRQSTGETFAGYGNPEDIHTGKNCLWIGKPYNGEPATPGNGVNVALLARTRGQVNEFYKSAIAAGAADEGAPGIREEAHPNFYATYLRDPSGNKLVVVCHE